MPLKVTVNPTKVQSAPPNGSLNQTAYWHKYVQTALTSYHDSMKDRLTLANLPHGRPGSRS